jgi:hypothetical protein
MQASKKFPKLKWLRPLGPITVVTIGILAVVIGKLDSEEKEYIRTVKNVPQGTIVLLLIQKRRFSLYTSESLSAVQSQSHAAEAVPWDVYFSGWRNICLSCMKCLSCKCFDLSHPGPL